MNKNNSVDAEIQAYIDSISGIDYSELTKAKGVLKYIRSKQGNMLPVLEKAICNTLKGKVHYHEIFGKGEIDYKQVMNAIVKSRYSGYCTVELYNHSDIWQEVAPFSYKFILAKTLSNFGWNFDDFGHIDHTKVDAPYFRVADAVQGKNGDISILYDLRLCQPNKQSLPTSILHTLEHCLLFQLPKYLPGFIGVGLMGCLTGLYITTVSPVNKKQFKEAVLEAFKDILSYKNVPYKDEKMCGMVINHNLLGAQEVIPQIIEKLSQR